MRVESTTRLLPLATTKHSTTNYTIYYKKGINKDNMEGNHSNASSFHSNPIGKCTIHLQAQIIRNSMGQWVQHAPEFALLKREVRIHDA
jgi:hypothetical protein